MFDNNKIGKNIKALRKLHGETQKELAESLYIGVNTISKYERGEKVGAGQKKTFDYEFLKTIADHYNIAVELIAETDLSNIKLPSFMYLEGAEVAKINKKIYPIFRPKEKIDNPGFYLANDAHQRFFEINQDTPDEEVNQLIDTIFSGYEDSWDDTLVADINLTSFMLFIYSGLKNITLSKNLLQIKKPALVYLSKYNSISEDTTDIESELFEDTSEMFFEMFYELKKKNCSPDCVEYFIALMYFNQLIDNDLGATNTIVGREMMNSLALLNNPYAKRFLNLFN